MEDDDFKEYVKALVQRGNEFYGDGVTIDIKEEKNEVPKQRREDIADEVNMVYSDLFDEFDLEYKNISIDLLAYFDGPDRNVERVGDAKLYNNKAVKYIYSENDEIYIEYDNED